MRDYLTADLFLNSDIIYTIADLHIHYTVSKVFYHVDPDDNEAQIIIATKADDLQLLCTWKKHASYSCMHTSPIRMYTMGEFFVIGELDIDITDRVNLYCDMYRSALTGLLAVTKAVDSKVTLEMMLCNLINGLLKIGVTCFTDLRADGDAIDMLVEECVNDLLRYRTTYIGSFSAELVDSVERRVSMYLSKGIDYVED